MEVHWMRDFRTKEWRCCGHVWQLMMSRLFPDRVTWGPTCPTCGTEGYSYPRRQKGTRLVAHFRRVGE